MLLPKASRPVWEPPLIVLITLVVYWSCRWFIPGQRTRRALAIPGQDAGPMKMALVTESFFPTIDGVTTTVKA
ncbi:MAG TPA: hypothetical protein VIP28_10300, partial [Nocardioides sp.]